MECVMTGHGGNVALTNREYTDYQVSILEVDCDQRPRNFSRMTINYS
jgi:hypothetical protein